jgi:branched-chain amino acid transport system permease protein
MSIVIQILLNGIIAAAVYVLMAMAFNVNYGVSRFFHLAQGGFAVVGGYAMLWFFQHTSWPVPLAIIASALIAGCVGWITDRVIFLPLRKKRASSLIQVVASLGLLLMLQAIVSIVFTVEYQSFPVSLMRGTTEIGGGIMTNTQLIILLVGVVLFGIMWSFLTFTKYGRAIKAVSDDAEVATMVGINTERVIGIVAFVASAIAGLAGILTGFDTGLQPIIGMTLILKGAIGGVVGGLGSLIGACSGGVLLGLVENFGTWFIASQWKDAIAFALLIVFLIFRPYGIISKK